MSKIYCIPSLCPSQSRRGENRPCRRTGPLEFGQGSDQIQSREITSQSHGSYAPHHDLSMRLLHGGQTVLLFLESTD